MTRELVDGSLEDLRNKTRIAREDGDFDVDPILVKYHLNDLFD